MLVNFLVEIAGRAPYARRPQRGASSVTFFELAVLCVSLRQTVWQREAL
jgi:hypothetical protein